MDNVLLEYIINLIRREQKSRFSSCFQEICQTSSEIQFWLMTLLIHSVRGPASRAYTPGAFGEAQPYPQLTTPYCTAVFPSAQTTGPQESPWHESRPLRVPIFAKKIMSGASGWAVDRKKYLSGASGWAVSHKKALSWASGRASGLLATFERSFFYITNYVHNFFFLFRISLFFDFSIIFLAVMKWVQKGSSEAEKGGWKWD